MLKYIEVPRMSSTTKEGWKGQQRVGAGKEGQGKGGRVGIIIKLFTV